MSSRESRRAKAARLFAPQQAVDDEIGPEAGAEVPRHGLRIVEDATHAFGTRVDGRTIGAFGDVTCFSFDPVKVITSIDGGAVVVGDPAVLERLRHWRFLGIDRETLARFKNRLML